MPAPKPINQPRLATGQTHILGHFCIKLNLSPENLVQLDEHFHMLLTLKEIGKDDSHFISDYMELEQSDWVRLPGKKLYHDNYDFRIPLAFKKDHGGKGYAECSLLCWAFHSQYVGNRYATLVYTQEKDRGGGIVVFKNVKLSELYSWNIQVRDQEKKLAEKEKRPERIILSPSAWQPEVAFGGKADIHLWRLPDPLPMVDSHLHIQSNHTAPLPLVWDKIPAVGNVLEFLRVGWDTRAPDKETLVKGVVAGSLGVLIAGAPGAVFGLGGFIIDQFRSGKVNVGLDQLSGLKFGESGRIGANKTDIIGNTLVTQLAKAPTWKLPFFANGGPTALATPLPMDMHYGHFHGYHGEPIYKKQNGVFTFRLNPFEENRGSISVQDTKAYEPYDRQIRNTVNAAQSLHNKWKILPLYHYDPRRWMEKSDVPESWETPFKAVNTSIQMSEKKWPFIGFKTYTSLGYMPLDTALPHQVDFYTRCEANGIPIMNHCTTAGMYTHDKPFYYDLWKMDPDLKSKHILDSGIERQEEALKAHISQLHTTIMDLNWTESETKLIQAKLNWFDRHYVYPSAWEPVVSCWKNLRLCLAHFCGYDYFGTKKFPNGSKDEKTGMVYGFPETDPGQFPDKAKTNPLIHGLCQLVRPDNQVHFDVSFFFVTEYNLEAIRNFYHWARGYKNGFMMDRMLWGSDWPLLATDSEKGKYLHEDQLKGYVDMNAKEWINLDPELWLKMAVINPIRFYNLEKLRGHLEKIFEMPAPVAFKSSATTVKELYAQSPRVIK